MNRFASLLAALALVAALFAPAGFMPARAADGAMIIRICSELDPGQDQVMRLDPRTGELMPHEAGDEQSETRHCDFANAGIADLPPLPILAAPPALFDRFEGSSMDALSRLSSTGLPPSTGPPFA